MRFVGNIVRNKSVQRAALRTGYNLGLGAAKKIQRRRQKRGRMQLWPTITAQPRRIMPRATNNALPVRVTQTSSGMPASAMAREVGTGIALILTQPEGSNFFKTTIDINPADSSFVPRLAKIAAVYQKFTCEKLVFRYVNTVGNNQNGYLCMVYLPDNSSSIPQTLDDFNNCGGVKDGQVGYPLTYVVDQKALNKAYNVNYTKVADGGEGSVDPINSAGRLCVSVGGLTPAATATYGTIYVDYVFRFTDPKLSNSDSTEGRSEWEAAGASSAYVALNDPDTHVRGLQLFRSPEYPDWYELRGKMKSALNVVLESTVSEPTITVQISEYPDGADAVALTAVVNTNGGTEAQFVSVREYLIPSGRHWVRLGAKFTKLHLESHPLWY